MRVFRLLQSAAVAGILGFGFLGASATPALADHVRTKCDNDGDTCWRVWCDWDWDDCHPVPGSVYHRYSYYHPRHYYYRPRYYSYGYSYSQPSFYGYYSSGNGYHERYEDEDDDD